MADGQLSLPPRDPNAASRSSALPPRGASTTTMPQVAPPEDEFRSVTPPGMDVDQQTGIYYDSSPLPQKRDEVRETVNRLQQNLSIGMGQQPAPIEGTRSRENRALAAGVITDRPASSRANLLAGFALDDGRARKAYEAVLADDINNSKSLESLAHSGIGIPVQTRIGPKTKELEYYLTDEKRFALAKSPSIAGAVGPATTIGPEILGAVIGAYTTGGAGILAGEGAGAFIGEVIRLSIGEKLGVNEGMTPDEMLNSAAKASGISIAGNVAGSMLGKLAFSIHRGVRGEVLHPEVSALFTASKSYELNMKELELSQQIQREINDYLKNTVGTASELRLNIAQASGAPWLLVRQTIFKNDARFAGEFGALEKAQTDAFMDYYFHLNDFQKDYLMREANAGAPRALSQPPSAGAVGAPGEEPLRRAGQNDIEDAIANLAHQAINVAPDVRQATINMRVAEQNFKRAYTDINTNAVPRKEFGRILQTSGTEIEKAFLAQADADAAGLTAMSGSGQIIRFDKFADEVARLSDANARLTLPGLRRSLDGFLGPDTVAGAAGNPVKAPAFSHNTTLTFDDAWMHLKALREQSRQASTGGVTDSPTAGIYKTLEKALLDDIETAVNFPNRKALKTAWNEFNQSYALNKQLFDEGLLGVILKRRGPGFSAAMEVGPKEAFDMIFQAGQQGVEANISQVVRLLDGRPRDMVSFRSALGDYYNERVMKVAPNGKPFADLKAHDQFIKEMKDDNVFHALGFTKRERAALMAPGNFSKQMGAANEQMLKAVAKVEKEFGDILNAPGLFQRMWNANDDVRSLSLLKKRLGDIPESAKAPVLRGLKYQALRHMDETITMNGPAGGRTINGAALDRYLNGKGTDTAGQAASRGHKRLLTELMGKEYVQKLDTLNKAILRAQREAPQRAGSRTAFWTTTVVGLSRAYVGMFTRPGRFVTAVAQMRGRAANEALYRSIMDAEDAYRFAGLAQADLRDRRVIAFMTAAGATDMYTMPDEAGRHGTERLNEYIKGTSTSDRRPRDPGYTHIPVSQGGSGPERVKSDIPPLIGRTIDRLFQ